MCDLPLESMATKCSFIVRGQGTFSVENPKQKGFFVAFDIGNLVLLLSITTAKKNNSALWRLSSKSPPVRLRVFPDVVVDEETMAPHWVSYFGAAKKLKYGVGEMRHALALIDFDLDEMKLPVKDLRTVWRVYCSEFLIKRVVHRDPVVIEPPLRIRPSSLMSLEDVAGNDYCSPMNLTKECQILYSNISGDSIKLDTKDFPQFSQAIERSIKNPNGWCHETLKRKAGLCGDPNSKQTYLRITLGVNQGESPGIPYVMEIWPSGHYSPIHAHAWSHAVIRVLYGQIQTELFPMLSPKHEKSFVKTTFHKDDVTWISPSMNQCHRLTNVSKDGTACITIQCYMYGEGDCLHDPYFDYLSMETVQQFDPNSDADFLEFKEMMKKEWESRRTI